MQLGCLLEKTFEEYSIVCKSTVIKYILKIEIKIYIEGD